MLNSTAPTRKVLWLSTWFVFWLASVKVAAGLLAYLLGLDERVGTLVIPLPLEVSLIQAVVFALMALLLAFGNRSDERALFLGVFFMLIASQYGRRFLSGPGPQEGWQVVPRAFGELEVEAFLALFLFLFVRRFPNTPMPFAMQRWLRFITRGAVGIGVLFFAVSFLRAWEVLYPMSQTGRSWFPLGETGWTAGEVQWILVAFLLIQAAVILGWKWRRAVGEEKHRGQVFVAALVVSCGPVALDAFMEALIPAYDRLLKENQNLNLARVLFDNALILAMPLTAGYSVLVHRALDVRLMARKAMQYALARSTVVIIVTAPFVLLCLVLYQNRTLTLIELAEGNQVVFLALAVLCGVLALSYRRRILDMIDHYFFRERYKARRVLTQLVDQVRGTRNLRELSKLVERGIDLALHLDSAVLLVEDPQLGQLVDTRLRIRPLATDSILAKNFVQSQQEPLVIDLESTNSILRDLPEVERHWIVDGQVQLLAPAFALDGSLIGLLALGAKKSELPFLKEDRKLLTQVCSAAGLVIELLGLKNRSPLAGGLSSRPTWEKDFKAEEKSPLPSDSSVEILAPGIEISEELMAATSRAMECIGCQRVWPPGSENCPRCELPLEETLVPYVLRRMFRFEERIGAGGMAVVYRATDLKLGRTVAIKTLPKVTPEAAIRLHREARTAATVSHPGLAAIHGIETWEGTPMLILEMLAGGTLADRIMEKPMDPLEVIETGQAVALALQKIHSVGILHRDVKPSNIGFTRDGVAKLLDFGVARLLHDLRRDPASHLDAATELPEVEPKGWTQLKTPTGEVAGTLSYLSPEAVAGFQPNPTFDLWSLCVVLYEALCGENLFFGSSVPDILNDIRAARVPSILEQRPDCPPVLATFFERALHVDPAFRSRSGRELHQRLETVRVALKEFSGDTA